MTFRPYFWSNAQGNCCITRPCRQYHFDETTYRQAAITIPAPLVSFSLPTSACESVCAQISGDYLLDIQASSVLLDNGIDYRVFTYWRYIFPAPLICTNGQRVDWLRLYIECTTGVQGVPPNWIIPRIELVNLTTMGTALLYAQEQPYESTSGKISPATSGQSTCRTGSTAKADWELIEGD